MIKNINEVQNIEHELQETEEPPSSYNFLRSDILSRVESPKLQLKVSTINAKSRNFLKKFFPLATLDDWNSWQWQIKNSITTLSSLEKVLSLSEEEKSYFEHRLINNILPVRITPYYASLLDPNDNNQALRKTVVPVVDEFLIGKGEESDPLAEKQDQPNKVKCIVHRYPDRVLFLVTGFCSTYCRYCTRSHMVAKDKSHVGIKAWQEGINYIREHQEIRDVLISGGDPLTMPDSHIEYLLSELRKIEHVQMIRLGTKVPVVLPQRITKNLLSILKKYHPLYLSIHFTHSDELTPEVKEACIKLANAGIPLGSQTVLLKGVNDEAEIIKNLMHDLLKIRVRPYYLYQCDPIPGSQHFRTAVQKGLDIIFSLRGNTSGYAIPHYVIDAPGGGGKIPLLPEYLVKHENGEVVLKNYENRLFVYPDVDN